MGTRADFYVGRGEHAEWLGSIAWDGYQEGLPCLLLRTRDEADYRERVCALLASRDDATHPEDGWPWPWEDSRMTDYAYAFDGGMVWASWYGRAWFDASMLKPETDGERVALFPDMSARRRVALGRRSGGIILALPQEEQEP